VLAPRHVHRANGLVNDAVSAGFKAKVTSQNGPLNDVDVVVLDEMGQLLTWYGVAQAAFIGGTLIDHGGHNFMEAAAAECPVIVGQSLYNFESMAALFLAERAMVQVQDEQALGKALGQLLSDDEERSRLSDSALRLVHRESGALDRTRAALIAANVLPDIAKGSER
jgi:3-deoxy-D-manno-octulosonic-acid transferase